MQKLSTAQKFSNADNYEVCLSLYGGIVTTLTARRVLVVYVSGGAQDLQVRAVRIDMMATWGSFGRVFIWNTRDIRLGVFSSLALFRKRTMSFC